jgi:hypothetical protein
MAKENQFDFEGGVVSVYRNGTYDYKGTNSNTISSLNPELHNRIAIAVKEFTANKEKILEARRLEEYVYRKELEQMQLDEFKEFVAKEAPELSQYKVKYNTAGNGGDMRWISIEGQSIRYENKVYSSGDWHPHTTNMCWVAEINYKRKRFTEFKSAVKKVLEYVNRNKEKDLAKKSREKEVAEYAKLVGLEVKKGWHRYANRNDVDGGYDTYALVIPSLKGEYEPVISLQLGDFDLFVREAVIRTGVEVFGVKTTSIRLSVNLKTVEEVKDFISKITY